MSNQVERIAKNNSQRDRSSVVDQSHPVTQLYEQSALQSGLSFFSRAAPCSSWSECQGWGTFTCSWIEPAPSNSPQLRSNYFNCGRSSSWWWLQSYFFQEKKLGGKMIARSNYLLCNIRKFFIFQIKFAGKNDIRSCPLCHSWGWSWWWSDGETNRYWKLWW